MSYQRIDKLVGRVSGPERIVAKAELVTIDGVEAMEKADFRNDETIREILRLELEIAAGCSSKKGNQSAAEFLSRLAGTTKDVDLAVLRAYSQLLDDLGDLGDLGGLEISSDYLREIGTSQFPENAAEYVKRLISDRKGGQRSLL